MNALGTSSLPLPGLSATLGLLYQTQHLLSSYPEFGNPQVIPDLLLTGCYNQGNSLNSLLGFPPSRFGSRGPVWNSGVCTVMFMAQVKGRYTGLSSSAAAFKSFHSIARPTFPSTPGLSPSLGAMLFHTSQPLSTLFLLLSMPFPPVLYLPSSSTPLPSWLRGLHCRNPVPLPREG